MYLLDANIFIQSNRSHYGLDFVPGFWDWIDRGYGSGTLCSIQKIADEINAGADDLTTWVSTRKPMFLQMDAASSTSLTQLATWASSVTYTPAAVATFLGSGDYQLVAFAHAHNHTVVTYERSSPDSKKRVKIPDAALAMGVRCIDPFTMLRECSASFVLS